MKGKSKYANVQMIEHFESYYNVLLPLLIGLVICLVIVNTIFLEPDSIIVLIDVSIIVVMGVLFIARKRVSMYSKIMILSVITVFYGGILFHFNGIDSNGVYVMMMGLFSGILFLNKKYSSVLLKIVILSLFINLIVNYQETKLIIKMINVLILIVIMYFGTNALKSYLHKKIDEKDFLLKTQMVNNKKIEHLAYYDQMTSLANRKYFWSLIDEKIEKKEKGVLIQFNIKDYNKINALYGYGKGDELIQKVAIFIKKEEEEGEIISYFGNNTFVLWSQIDESKDVIRNRFSEMLKAFNNTNSNYIDIEMYLAAIPVTKDNTYTTSDLINISERMIAKLKKENKDFIYYNGADLKELENNIKLTDYVKTSIVEDNYRVLYQRKYNSQDNSFYGLEVLSRLSYNGNPISPPKFIDILENESMIYKFGNYIFDKVFKDFKELIQKHSHDVVVSFNVSPKQLIDASFFSDLKELMSQHKINPRNLELEITEDVLVDNLDKLTCIIEEIREIGIRISLDDFGTGYSSLNYLKKLPVDIIKIDRSFITDIDKDAIKQSILKAIVDISESHNLDIVSEGVETEKESNTLQALGCYKMQGYLYAKPTEIENIK